MIISASINPFALRIHTNHFGQIISYGSTRIVDGFKRGLLIEKKKKPDYIYEEEYFKGIGHFFENITYKCKHYCWYDERGRIKYEW